MSDVFGLIASAKNSQSAAQQAAMAARLDSVSAYRARNYKKNPGQLLTTFTTIGDWSQDEGTTTVDTANSISGAALKLQASADAGYMQATKTISVTLGTDKRIRVRYKLNDAIADYQVLPQIYIATAANWSKFLSHRLWDQWNNNVYRHVGGWNEIVIEPGSAYWNSSGGATLSETIVAVRFMAKGAAGKRPSILVDEITYGMEYEPKVILGFDDGLNGVHDTAYPIMEQYGFKGTSYVIASAFGTDDYMSKAKRNTLYAAGWDIGNHSNTHPDFTGMTSAAILSEIETAITSIEADGHTRGARHFAIPNGIYDENANVAVAIAASRLLTVRSSDQVNKCFYPGTRKRLFLPSRVVYNSNTTLANLITDVETAIANGQSIEFMFHNIVTSPGNDYQYPTATFTAFIKYLYQRGVSVVPKSVWYGNLNTPEYN
jgi:peptidoglycan/xylan/chitin deacetylase (PgdA/CDA1 family)